MISLPFSLNTQITWKKSGIVWLTDMKIFALVLAHKESPLKKRKVFIYFQSYFQTLWLSGALFIVFLLELWNCDILEQPEISCLFCYLLSLAISECETFNKCSVSSLISSHRASPSKHPHLTAYKAERLQIENSCLIYSLLWP